MYKELDLFMQEITKLGYPLHVADFIRKVVIARGGCKALIIRTEVTNYTNVLHNTISEFNETASTLKQCHASPAEVLEKEIGVGNGRFVSDVGEEKVARLQTAGKLEKIKLLVVGAVPIMQNLIEWLRKIIQTPEAHFFVGGDSTPGAATDFVPKGFEIGGFIANLKPVVAKYHGGMLAAVASAGWPPKKEAGMYCVGKQTCRHCTGQFSNLWVLRGACFHCDAKIRQEGRCPQGKRCPPAAFCPHHQRCIACEGWSCNMCGIVCGDGEYVAGLVDSIQPDAVFMDFDRTLCTTKSGSSPLHGRHSIDAELAGIMLQHPNVHVVTRNRHTSEIATFFKVTPWWELHLCESPSH